MKKTGQQFEVKPVMPKNRDGSFKKGRYGKKPPSEIIYAHSSDDALKIAVVLGSIPSNTVMQYYEAIPLRK